MADKNKKDKCAGVLKKITCAVQSDCGSFAVSLVETGLSLSGPGGNVLAMALTTTLVPGDMAGGNIANGIVDTQGSGGNALGVIAFAERNKVLGAASVATSVISDVYYGYKCFS